MAQPCRSTGKPALPLASRLTRAPINVEFSRAGRQAGAALAEVFVDARSHVVVKYRGLKNNTIALLTVVMPFFEDPPPSRKHRRLGQPRTWDCHAACDPACPPRSLPPCSLSHNRFNITLDMQLDGWLAHDARVEGRRHFAEHSELKAIARAADCGQKQFLEGRKHDGGRKHTMAAGKIAPAVVAPIRWRARGQGDREGGPRATATKEAGGGCRVMRRRFQHSPQMDPRGDEVDGLAVSARRSHSPSRYRQSTSPTSSTPTLT